jgi:hypothetical protein
MADIYAIRTLALSMTHIRRRMRDDLGIMKMIESGMFAVKVKESGPFARNVSDDFAKDLKKRIREAEEFLQRAEFSISDEALVEAYEHTRGVGPDAEALLAEIRHRGVCD